MDPRTDFLFKEFLKELPVEPTSCQKALFERLAEFFCTDDGDIMVVNGYAGTGKTTAISAVIRAMKKQGMKSVLLAPTGRSAKVLEKISGRHAYTIHKHIYRQSSVGAGGMGKFSLSPNKARNTLFVVDEVSLIGDDRVNREGQEIAFGTGNLLEDLVKFVRSGVDCCLVLLGDDAQLPPVGLPVSPALSRDTMAFFGGVDYCTLTTVVRQEKQSGILLNATRLRDIICNSSPDEMIGDVKLDLRGIDDVERISGGELIEAISNAYDKYGSDETVVLCRSNKRAIRYNMGIRSTVLFKEEQLCRSDRLMVVKNCYQFLEDYPELDYIANGDIAVLERIRKHEDRYGLHFASARLSFPDYDDVEIEAKVILDTLQSETASLTYEQQNALYEGVSADYSELKTKKKIWDAVREDPYFNALQIKYAHAITCHKSQGGQWNCVFIDCPFWQDEQSVDDLKWLYTALTRAVEKVYLVNFPDRFFV